jgi:hypothetical protein
MKITHLKLFALILFLSAAFVFGYEVPNVFAQASASTLFVPLIGITSVPNPSSLPSGPGNVKYNYAVKNFLREVPLTNVQVSDDKCAPVKFVQGDDNHDSKLDFSETWRYSCTTRLESTTDSIATAIGTANSISASHSANTTVIVGSSIPAPLVSIVNVTKIPSPLVLPAGGGAITYTYKVNNPGVVPLGNVIVSDNGCAPISGKLGDTNGNDLLDTNEVWIYSCSTTIAQSMTNTATVNATANGLRATDSSVLNVLVDIPAPAASPNIFDVGISPVVGTANINSKIIIWGILSGILAALILFFVLFRKQKLR